MTVLDWLDVLWRLPFIALWFVVRAVFVALTVPAYGLRVAYDIWRST